jgi:hypothetical protein
MAYYTSWPLPSQHRESIGAIHHHNLLLTFIMRSESGLSVLISHFTRVAVISPIWRWSLMCDPGATLRSYHVAQSFHRAEPSSAREWLCMPGNLVKLLAFNAWRHDRRPRLTLHCLLSAYLGLATANYSYYGTLPPYHFTERHGEQSCTLPPNSPPSHSFSCFSSSSPFPCLPSTLLPILM